jgi:uncharacterized membrane protein YtjA (UPF0391 family)
VGQRIDCSPGSIQIAWVQAVRACQTVPWNLSIKWAFFWPVQRQTEDAVGNLLYYAIVFLVVALVAAALGFGGVAGTAMEGARILFWVAIVLFVISLVAGLVRRGNP